MHRDSLRANEQPVLPQEGGGLNDGASHVHAIYASVERKYANLMGAMLTQVADSMSSAPWTAAAVILAVVVFRILMEELLQQGPGRAFVQNVRHPVRRSTPPGGMRQALPRPRPLPYLSTRMVKRAAATIE